jgi:hypothetical protein
MKTLKLWLKYFLWILAITALVLGLGVPIMDWYFRFALHHSNSGYVMAAWMVVPFIILVPSLAVFFDWFYK